MGRKVGSSEHKFQDEKISLLACLYAGRQSYQDQDIVNLLRVQISTNILLFFCFNTSEGFVEEAENKGLLVNWSPQAKVLANKAVGCFFTHCGWNLTIEALSLGVPMVTMPGWSDQQRWKISFDSNLFTCIALVFSWA
ncbi:GLYCOSYLTRANSFERASE [Salix purpurea]|uniref:GLYCOSYLTRANSFERASE n=1 Tax=Salix purpurea TaxID=77065 RepID=A0A9Q0ZNW1_SALPP|nr:GLYCOSYLTRANSFERASE [Salix purpurea]